MNFTLTLTAMRESRDHLRTESLENPGAAQWEVLGRASRWLDEHDEARRAFLLAAGDITLWLGRPLRLRRPRNPNPDHISPIFRPPRRCKHPDAQEAPGTYLYLAGERDLARQWLKGPLLALRAEQVFGDPSSTSLVRSDLGRIHYLMGDWKGVLGVLDSHRGLPWQLAAARLGHDIDVVGVRAMAVAAIQDLRRPPYESQTPPPWTDWEWLEESFVVQSLLDGAAVPSHLQMLKSCGLLADDRAD